MKALRISLCLAALMCLSAAAGLLIPMESFSSLAAHYGAGAETRGAFFEYLFRLFCAVAASCGVFYAFLAWDPRRHGPLVPVGGGALVFTGFVALFTGLSGRMPNMMFLLDFAGCALIGALVMATWFLSVKKRQS